MWEAVRCDMEELLTVKDVAGMLKVRPSTLYAWVSEAKIPSLKVHGLIRFRREEVQGWLESFRGVPVRPSEVKPERCRRADVDSLIARVKRQVYSSAPGDQTDAEGKGG